GNYLEGFVPFPVAVALATEALPNDKATPRRLVDFSFEVERRCRGQFDRSDHGFTTKSPALLCWVHRKCNVETKNNAFEYQLSQNYARRRQRPSTLPVTAIRARPIVISPVPIPHKRHPAEAQRS